jgi:hypothetical protein
MLLAAKVAPAKKKRECAEYQTISTKTGSWSMPVYMARYNIITDHNPDG